ncbi:MAG: vWA domain-containing protein [Gammaproteobacteria bacterium]
MFIRFFDTLKQGGVPCTLRELLDFLAALEKGLVIADIDGFYALAKTTMVKDEQYYDKFDQAFDVFFKGVEEIGELFTVSISEDWLKAQMQRNMDNEEMKRIEEMGGIDKLVEDFKQRWQEQKERHEKGNRWIGTAGTSPYGNSGQNQFGIKAGGEDSEGSGKGNKSWQQRRYRDLDGDVELGTRNIKIALRRLRHFTRTGHNMELDLNRTIKRTADNAGMLQVEMRPERTNQVKVLVFFDVGGSMDPYVKVCEELFSACRSEFKHLEYFYFHNFVYESVWRANRRRYQEKMDTLEIFHKYNQDYCVIFVGDATMAPYEITSPGGSIEHWNEEPGMVWLQRFMDHYQKSIWINPVPQEHWDYAPSIEITRQLLEDRMYGLTTDGLADSMQWLAR